jgi:REP element-mobilizing transposase RayT
MPRPLRIQLEGAVYVVTARGLSEEPLFKDPADEQAYLQLLADYHQRHGFTLYAWCLLPDGIHLCVEPAPGTSLSTIMHDLSAGYTRAFNKRYGRSGHLFQARYKAVVAEKATCLLDATAQVHLQPVRLGLVRSPQEHAASSFRAYVGGDSVIAVSMDEVTAQLPASAANYAAYIASVDAARVAARFQLPVVGSETFVATTRSFAKAEADASIASAPQPMPMPAPRPPRPRLAVVGTCAVVLAAGLVGGVTLLSRRVVSLERAVVALAQENEAAFKTHYSAPIRTPADMLASLEGTEWDIHVAPLQGTAVAQADALEFNGRRVASSTTIAQGFQKSTYMTISQPGGRMAWESVQTNANGDVITWHGEWHGPQMRGVMVKQAAGKRAEQFTFVGVARGAAQPRSTS